MSDIGVEELTAAIRRVIPDNADMNQKDMAEYLIENEESFREALVAVGAVEKGAPGPTDILDGFYTGGNTETTAISPEIAKAVKKHFAPPPDVDTNPEESPSLGLHYGGQVETQSGSSKGDHYPTDDEDTE